MTVHLEGGFGANYRTMYVQRWLIPSKKQAFNPPAPGPWSDAPSGSVPGEIEDPTADVRASDPAAAAAKH
jgi:hypothetical protein